MSKRITVLFACAVLAITGLLALRPATANAACSDVAVVFARGTAETAPPLGITGASFVQALRDQVPGKSVAVRPVDYPASSNFNNRYAFVENMVTGIRNAQQQIVSISKRCPKTDIVVGGYSQGAAVATYALSERIVAPLQYERYQSQAPKPLPAEVSSHVAAVVLFAPPSSTWIRQVNAPEMKVGPSYVHKTRSYCIPGDTVCDGARIATPNGLHVLYAVNGMTVDAAQFTAHRL